MENKNPLKILIKTFRGLEDTLADECKKLGAVNIETLTRAVSCEGDMGTIYKLNYQCRTALRILVPLTSFRAEDEEQVYNNITHFEWKDIFDANQTFAVSSTLVQSQLNHTHYVSLKAKDAIADYFRKVGGTRPDVDTENPDFLIQVHISKDYCTVYLDSTGENLYKRGWRVEGHLAPLNEVLAAGIIQISGWNNIAPVVDFMCGSGTLLIEAAMLALQIPAGFYRKHYAFAKWKDYDAALWKTIKDAADNKIIERPLRMYGSDNDMRAVEATLANVNNVQLQEFIHVEKKNFMDCSKQFEVGKIFVNPPYDVRISLDDAVAFYKDLGNIFKRNYAGWQAHVLAGNLEAAKFIGLKPNRKHLLYNGPIECKLLSFNLFEGKKYGNVSS